MDHQPTVLMIVTTDTKREEGDFLRGKLEQAGLNVQHLDASIRQFGDSHAEITPDKVAAAAGTDLDAIRALNHEGKCQAIMVEGAIAIARKLYTEGKVQGVIGIGGSMGTTLGTAVMRALPFGLPKVMVTTMASGMTRPFVGTRDVTMFPSVADISGINQITSRVFSNAAASLAGQVHAYEDGQQDAKPLVLMTTLGTTEACSKAVRQNLEAKGFEVVIFHSTGTGGMTMDELAAEQDVAVVLDLSLSEINDLLNDGLCSAGPDRCRPAIRKGIPTLFVPGNVDFIIGGPHEISTKQFPGKRFHIHNPALTAIRTEEPELEKFARHMKDVINEGNGKVEFMVPLKGFSAHDSDTGHLQDTRMPLILTNLLREHLPERTVLTAEPHHINDQAFADAIVRKVIELHGGLPAVPAQPKVANGH